MNRKRSTRNLTLGSIGFLVLVAVVLATVGVFHAYIKNMQVQVARETQKTEKGTQQLSMDIKMLQMRIDQQLILPLLRDRLKQSSLVPIPINVIEEIDQRAVNHIPAPDLAQRGP